MKFAPQFVKKNLNRSDLIPIYPNAKFIQLNPLNIKSVTLKFKIYLFKLNYNSLYSLNKKKVLTLNETHEYKYQSTLG